MRISSIGNILGTYNAQKFTSSESKRVGKSKDSVDISSTAKEYQIAQKALMHSPDIRDDKVKELKDKIQSGNYNINANEIADKIVNSMFDTKA